MGADREELIRARAREIWEREGKPEGRADAHWEQATREIDEELGAGNNDRPESQPKMGNQGKGTSKKPRRDRNAANKNGSVMGMRRS